MEPSPSPSTPAPRRRWTVRIGVALVALTGGVALGPRRAVDRERIPTLAVPAKLEAVEAFVARRERAHPDVRPDAEARVVWASPDRPGRTPLAVVYLHGFSACRQETAPFCARLAASLGANLFEARLRGHGRSQDAMGEATAEDWLADAAQALAIGRLLGERVVVVGCSTGATLAAWCAGPGRASDLEALILLSPNFAIHHPAAFLMTGPWGAPWPTGSRATTVRSSRSAPPRRPPGRPATRPAPRSKSARWSTSWRRAI